MRALLFAGVLATGITTALAGAGRAAPIAYDGINYPPGPLNADGPAFGFAVPWLADPNVLVVVPGLASPLDLPAAGNAVGQFFNYQAPLVNVLGPLPPGREFWASFLLSHFGPNDQTYMGLSAPGSPFGAPADVAWGVRLGQYGLFVAGVFTPAPTPFTPAGSTDFLVTHFISTGGSWIVELYVNSAAFVVPDLVLNVPPIAYGNMVNQNQAEFVSDEFRLGDTASDVSAFGVTPTDRNSWGRVKRLYR